jgi:arylsulfatase A-like enzyme
MKRRSFLESTALTAAALGTGGLASAAAPRRPNVIVILTDDQGYGDFSWTGNPILKTPHTDRLAAQSVRFTDFHVTPVCTPSRSQLMTGNDCLHNLASAVTAGRTIMRRDMPTMAELFQRAGYATGLFGKWHLGHSYPDRPMDRGFDKAVWFKGWGLQSEIEFDNDYVNPRYLDDLTEKVATKYCTDLWFDEAMAWIRTQAAAREPFFVYLPTNTPHMPLWPPDSHAKLYEGQVPANVAAFFAMIANYEDNFGRLEQFLKDTGLFDNTIVVFTGDNGGTQGRSVTNHGLRDIKASNYEGGHRVPCLLRWPAGGLEAAVDVNTPAQIQDLLPTLLELCDVPSRGAGFDGTSLVPLMRGRQIPERMLVVQYGARSRPIKYDAAVIWNHWRLQKGTELYDIDKDRGQQSDVAAQHPAVAARMRAFYDQWWTKREPGFSAPVPVLLGVKGHNPTLLTSVDWWEVDCDNINFVSNGTGGPRGGTWHLDVQTAGTYRFELRRWPFHTNMALGSEGPRQTIHGRPLTQPVKRMPATSVVLAADGREQSVAVTPESVGGTVTVTLTKGRHVLQGWLRDRDGNDLCGAYYAQVTLA